VTVPIVVLIAFAFVSTGATLMISALSDSREPVSVRSGLIARDYRYAWQCGLRWVGYYLRQGRVLGALRAAWYTFALGHIGEACQECGRPYPLWTADHGLYERVTGNARRANGEWAAGLFCLDCFDHKARERGITLRWRPEADGVIAHARGEA
jgi:hypothetical protein